MEFAHRLKQPMVEALSERDVSVAWREDDEVDRT